MFDLHLARKRGKIIAVADIGSGSAAFAVVAIKAGKPAQLLTAERSVLPLEERAKEATVAALGDQLVQAGQKVLRSYAQSGKKVAPIDKVYCIIRAPWSRSRSVQAMGSFPEPRVITGQMISTLAKHALDDEQELDKQQILEAAVVRVELNGYETREPEKKVAQRVSVSALVSDCDAGIRAAAAQALSTLVPHLPVVYRSSTRALLSALHGLPNHEEDHLIIEIGSGGSNLTTVRDGEIGEQRTVPEGVASILKRLAPTGMPEETRALVRMVDNDQCSTTACEEIQAAMAKIEPELVRSFAEGMAACAVQRKLPTNLMLVVQADFIPWLSKFFTRIDFTQFTATTQPFSVKVLTVAELSGAVVPAEHMILDAGLALSVALVNREENGA